MSRRTDQHSWRHSGGMYPQDARGTSRGMSGRGGEAWAREQHWDEDRYGYPESNDYGYEMQRSRHGDEAPPGRFGQHGVNEDRFGPGMSGMPDRERDWGSDWGSGQRGSARGQDMSSRYGHGGRESREGRDFQSSRGYGGGNFRGGSSWGSPAGSGAGGFAGAGVYGGYGIPSGGEMDRVQARGPSMGDWASGSSGVGRDWGGQQPTARRTPRNYTRSDERIKDDLCERLYHGDVDVGDVSVEVRNGTVTLEGSVPSRQMKHRIEDLCEHCIGVQDVENRIRVSREGGAEASRGERESAGVSTPGGERGRKAGSSTGTTPH